MNSDTKKGILICILLAVGIVAALALEGCGSDTNSQGNIIPNTNRRPPLVQDFFLDDGTRCIFAKRANAGGLSCDFDANRRRAER